MSVESADSSDSFAEYRRDKQHYGDRVDRPPAVLGWTLVALLVIANAAAWGYALPGYVKLIGTYAGTYEWSATTDPETAPARLLHRRRPDEIAVVFLDVGQGDAVFVQTPGGQNLLIDAGQGPYRDAPGVGPRNAGSRVVLPFLRRNRIDHLDYLVITHPHSDHLGGAVTIVETLPVREVWLAGVNHPTRSKQSLLDALESERETRLRVPREAGGDLRPGTPLALGPAVRGWLVHTAPRAPSVNASSLCLLLAYGSTEWLFPGDIERKQERSLLLRWGEQLDVDVLKAAHHGSHTSNSPSFLRVARPVHTVISVGENNPFGHPDTAVIQRLRQVGSDVYRTDRQESVYMFSNGEDIRVHTEALLDSKPTRDRVKPRRHGP